MNSRLLALKLFKEKSSVSAGLADKTEIDWAELASTIFLKFIDVIEAALVIILGILVTKLVKRHLQKIEAAHESQKTALNLFEKIVTGFLLVVTFTLALKIVGLDLTLILSVLTLGLSFGLRDVIKNYVAGLLILFKAPFKIGDIIKIRNFTGHVERIEFQSVTVKTFDHKEITIHNSDLLTQPITNFSRMAERRLEIEVQLGYGTEVARALQIFDRLLSAHPLVLKEPRYSVIFRDFRNTGLIVLIRFWVNRPANVLRIRSEIALQITESFDEAKILAPFAREAGLSEGYGMSEPRKQRLAAFYGQPLLADLVAQTAVQVAATTQPAPSEYIDAEEPE